MGLQDSFPLSSPVFGVHPFSVVQPLIHQGSGPEEGSSFFGREKCGRAGTSSFSRLLQPIVCRDEGLRVLETDHRSFHSEYLCSQVSIQGGDSPVCSSVCVEQRLDGVFGLEGVLLANSNSSEKPQVSQIRCFRMGLPVQGSVFWSLHSSSSLPQH